MNERQMSETRIERAALQMREVLRLIDEAKHDASISNVRRSRLADISWLGQKISNNLQQLAMKRQQRET